ncbi:hypothetical protein [Streptomyces sp. NRRL S-87]|uniref:hypothetical protein n=1 Tax=Streptomyces sp. NRRL S-87 TaxID=1463920 RepID=UPI0018FF1472|nr:hypothetical protein [Streptomyces sp. NRRL S-87]
MRRARAGTPLRGEGEAAPANRAERTGAPRIPSALPDPALPHPAVPAAARARAGRTASRTGPLLAGLLLLAACAPPAPPPHPAPDDLVKAATRRLTDACLADRGLAPPRPGATAPPGREERVADALFGTGPTELALALPTGYTVRAHTDGCLARAQQQLYGDQAAWFRASVTVNNLRPLAEARLGDDPAYTAALARAKACDDGDAGCVRASGLPQVRARLEPAVLAEVRAAHREEIATYDRLRDRAAHRATAVLAAVPAPPGKGHPPR